MATKPQTQQTPNLPAVAVERKIDLATWSCLTNSIFPGAKPESIAMAVDYCRARKLDVLKKVCHIVPMQVKNLNGDYEWRDVIMPGIAEHRTTAFRTGEYAGISEAEYGPIKKYKGVEAPEWCKVIAYRFISGERCSFPHTEYFAEAVATKKTGEINSMWRRRPFGQLAKCAEAGALRKACPEELGGEHVAEEMEGKEIIDMGAAERVDDEPTIKEPQPKSKPPAGQTKQAAPDPAQTNAGANDSTPAIGDAQIRIIKTKLSNNGVDESALLKQFGIGDLRQITMGMINDVLKWIGAQGQ